MEFRFSLIDPQTGVTTILPDEPIGWDSGLFNIERDDFYKGLMFTHSGDLEFINEGYSIIKNAYDTYGVDYILNLKIEQQCDDNSEFETIYLGVSTFALFQDTTADYCSCKLPFEDQGPQMILKNREDVPINLNELQALDGATLTPFTYGPYDLTMHSRSLIQSSKLSAPGGNSVSQAVNVIDSDSGLEFPMVLLIETSELPTIAEYSTFPSVGAVSSSSPDTLFTAPETGTYQVSYNFQGFFTDVYDKTRTYHLTIARRINGVGTLIYDYGTLTHGAGSYSYTISLDQTIPYDLALTAGDTVSFYVSLSGYSSTIDATDPIYTLYLLDGSFLKFSKKITAPSTTAKSFAIHEHLARLTQSIFNNEVSLSSSFYGRTNSQPNAYSKNGNGSFLASLNGYAIRGFPIADRPLFSTLKDTFMSLNAIDCIAMGLEKKSDGTYQLSVEPLEKFFQGTIFLYFDNVFEVKRSVAEDRFYNELEIGYEKYGTEQGTDKTNVNDVFCSQHNYLIPQRSIKRKLSAMSPYIADQYSIEYTRRNRYVATATEQWEFDEDNFLICLNRTVNGSNVPTSLDIAEKDENYDSITNTNDPATGYNYRISIDRNYLKWAKVISASIYKTAGATVKFTKGLLNYIMVSKFSSDNTEKGYNNNPLAENASLAWDDSSNFYGAPLWSPEYYEFEYPLGWNQYKLIKDNPKSCIAFSHSGSDFIKGFIISVSYSPVEGKAKFKVLKAFNQSNTIMGLPGELKFINCTNDELPNFFDAGGLGVNEWEGWAIADGRNGTDDLRTRGLAQYDYSNSMGPEYNVLKSTIGTKEVTLLSTELPPHIHGQTGNTYATTGGSISIALGGGADRFQAFDTQDGSSQGLDGDAHENRPPTYICIIAQPIA